MDGSGLNQEFSKDADFVLVGISSDPDAKAWRSFVAAEKMDWVEALDSRFHTIGRFGVREFPTYIVMDRVGGVRLVTTGLAENFYGGDSMETRMAIVKAVTAALRSTER